MTRPNTGSKPKRLGPNRWQVRVTVPSGDGRQHRITRNVTGTRRDAQAVLEQLLGERTRRARAGRPTVGTFAELVEKWWPKTERRLSPNTVSSWRSAMNRYILPRFGERRVDSITRQDCDEFAEELAAGGLRGGRVKTILTVVSSVLGQAEQWGVVDRNVAYGIEVAQQRSTVEGPALDRIGLLLAAARDCHPDMVAVIMLAADTGLRRAELCSLRWRDVDVAAGLLVCRHAVAKGAGGGAVLRQTKTGAVAAITLSEGSVIALRAQRARQEVKVAGLDDVDMAATYVFGELPDRPLYPDTMTKRFAAVRTAAGLDDVTPRVELRGLRHSSATLLLTEGVDIRTVSARHRHARTSTTLDRYADHVPAADAHAAAVMSRLLELPQ